MFANKHLKWWATIPGWIAGDVVGATAAYLLTQELTSEIQDANIDFEVALLRVCTLVILADGSVEAREKSVTRNHFIQMFGQKKAEAIFKEAKTSRLKNYSLRELAIVMGNRKSKVSQYAIFQFLYKLASVDGEIHPKEDALIRDFAFHLSFSESTLKSIRTSYLSGRNRSTRFDHVTMKHLSELGLDEKATIADVKSAYRRLSKEFHPDMIIDMTPAFKEMAKEKFLNIQHSYEYLIKNL